MTRSPTLHQYAERLGGGSPCAIREGTLATALDSDGRKQRYATILTEYVSTMKTRFVYVGIRVQDLQRSLDFYTKLLGMKEFNRYRIEETKGQVVNLHDEKGGFTLELNYYEPGSQYNTKYAPGEGLDHLAFKVDDLGKAVEEARSAGYPPVCEVRAGGSRWIYIEDPDGIWIELY